MRASDTHLLGQGIYSLAEATRLTKVSTWRIRRWLRGYRFRTGGVEHSSPAVWAPGLPELDGKLALSFLDLIDVRFVDAFLRAGVSWPTLRRSVCIARERMGSSHPFSTERFRTDGHSLFVYIQEHGEESLIELVRSQQYFKSIISPCFKDIEFVDDEPSRWWPLGRRRMVVVDPQRNFGQPIISGTGIPTAILARAAKASASVEAVAQWYEIDARAVRNAVEFQDWLTTTQQAA